MTTRRDFLGLSALGAAAALGPRRPGGARISIDVRPTALYGHPDGRANLVRITVTGLDAPAARARVVDRHGGLVGTAGLLPAGEGTFAGEVWVPLAAPAQFQVDLEVGRRRVSRASVRLTPPRRWTLYLLSSVHTAVGGNDLQERTLEAHRRNLDAALARLGGGADHRWTAECALQVLSYMEQRSPAAGAALVEALRAGTVGFGALFANVLAGLLDHETYARLVWPAGHFAREHGLAFTSAQLTAVPGAPATLPTLLAASGVRYLASAVDAERALPLLPREETRGLGLAGDGITYPQIYWWEGPDGARVLHWRGFRSGDAARLGFAEGADAMARRLTEWLLADPVLLGSEHPFDSALVYGVDPRSNATPGEALVEHVAEFRRRYAFPRIVPGRPEEFFRAIEQQHGPRLRVRRGDTGTYREDGAAAAARELARFRETQLAARAAEVLALWDELVDPGDAAAAGRARERAGERRQMWRDLLLFGEHTWGADVSVSAPDSAQTVAQWEYKRRFLESAAAAARAQVRAALLAIGRRTRAGLGRLVFNASSWERTDVVRVPGGAGVELSFDGRDLPSVDLPDGDALALVREVPALGYLALAARPRGSRPPLDDGSGAEAYAGGHALRLDSASGAIASLVTPDGTELVKPGPWSGLNQVIYVTGGEGSALWTGADRTALTTAPALDVAQATLDGPVRRERLPGIGVRLVARRRCAGLDTLVSTVTLYDDLPWVDVENRLTKPETLAREALYVAFPFAFVRPEVDVEVPLGRMRVERDQQPGACRDWYCHTHWIALTEGGRRVLWSGPDTPLVTLNDLFRGAWRRTIEPDGTLFAWALHNYWHRNFPARQGGEFVQRFRISAPQAGDATEPVRRGWAACDPLYVSESYDNRGAGHLLDRDRALLVADSGVCVVGVKPADDGEGTILKLLDVAGRSRGVTVWAAASRFQLARRCNLVEMNADPLPVAGDGATTVEVPAWGVAAARLFTPRERGG